LRLDRARMLLARTTRAALGGGAARLLRLAALRPSVSLLPSVASRALAKSKSGKDGDDAARAKPAEDDAATDDSSPGSAVVKYDEPEEIETALGFIAIPTTTRPLFPGIAYPVHITNETLVDALLKAADSNPFVAVFLTHADGATPTQDGDLLTGTDGIHSIGCLASIARVMPLGPGQGVHALLYGKRRVQIEHVVERDPVLRVKVKMLRDVLSSVARARGGEVAKEAEVAEKEADEAAAASAEGGEAEFPPLPAPRRRGKRRVLSAEAESESNHRKAYTLEIVSTIKEIVKLNPLFKEQMQIFLDRVDMNNPSTLADMGAAVTTGEGEALQEVLEETNIEARLRRTLELLKKELELSRVQSKISKQAEENLSKDQRNYILRQQLKQIKRELGMEKDDKEMLLNKFDERLASKTVPEDARKVIEEEKLKLQSLENTSAEFNTTRNYLDWLTAVPWGIYKKENLEIDRAERILDEEHFGMQDVKERIKEFIAVSNLAGSTQGKILCFVGPPGVGKTSIGKSIAKALDREFYRFSVGGLHDVAEIKGHRRTYVGAMPGKLIQCLKATNTANPVVMIDEIDKLGRGFAGDPSSALLEVLDPSQNQTFVDHYLDVPVDLSKMLFLCTANMTDSIPAPLLDRMEVVRLSGYVTEEKMAILKQYIYPTAREGVGLKPEQMELSDSAALKLIRWYCREAGVRNLQKHADKICRKVALKVVKGGPELKLPLLIGEDNLEDYVGKPQWHTDRIYGDETPPGVVMGLAWTSMGGSVLYIESASLTPTDAEVAAEAAEAEAEAEARSAETSGSRTAAQPTSTTAACRGARRWAAEQSVDSRTHCRMKVAAAPLGAPLEREGCVATGSSAVRMTALGTRASSAEQSRSIASASA